MARCAQTTCPQHLYRKPALRLMCTRPMAPHLTGPLRSLTTANCSVAPKSTKHCNHARPGRQASGCKARWGGHLGMQKSLNTPHPAGLECRPSQVQVSAGLGQRTWRHQWRPTQGRVISPPLPLLLSSSCLVFLAGPQRSSLSLAAALPLVRGAGRRPGWRAPPAGCLSVKGVITVMRDPVGIQGFQPQDSAPAPSFTLHKALHPPQPSPCLKPVLPQDPGNLGAPGLRNH